MYHFWGCNKELVVDPALWVWSGAIRWQTWICSNHSNENALDSSPERLENHPPALLARMKIYGLIKTADSILGKWLTPTSK